MKFLSEKLKGLSQGNVFDFLMMIYASFFLFSEEKFNIKGKILPVLFVLAFLSFYAGLVLKALSYRFEFAKRWLELGGGWSRATDERGGELPEQNQYYFISVNITSIFDEASIFVPLCLFTFTLYPFLGIIVAIVFRSLFEINFFGSGWDEGLIIFGFVMYSILMPIAAWHLFSETIKENEFIKLQKSKLTHWSVNLFATVCLFFSAIVFMGFFNLLLYSFSENNRVYFAHDPALGDYNTIIDILMKIFGIVLLVPNYLFLLFLLYFPPRFPLMFEDLMRFYFTARGRLVPAHAEVEVKKRFYRMLVSFSLALAPSLILTFIGIWSIYFGSGP